MDNHEPTEGEIASALARLADADNRQVVAIDRLTNAMERLADQISRTYLRLDVYEAEKKAITTDVDRLEDSIKWATRTAVAAFALPILVTIIAGASLAAIL